LEWLKLSKNITSIWKGWRIKNQNSMKSTKYNKTFPSKKANACMRGKINKKNSSLGARILPFIIIGRHNITFGLFSQLRMDY
jgi:hypothetical protein